MKKVLIYATIAVLLGVALMLAPFLAFPVRIEMDTYTEKIPTKNFSPENSRVWSASSEPSAGVIPHYPMDAISVGLMLTFSLVFAFIVFSQLKKRTA